MPRYREMAKLRLHALRASPVAAAVFFSGGEPLSVGYRAVAREPIRADYHGVRIVTAPPPSSEGIVLAEALNILEGYQIDRFDAPTRKHVIGEALRRAYQDRAEHLGVGSS